MSPKAEFCVTREEHLNHMVRVVPFIVTAYILQCFFIIKLAPEGFATNWLILLGIGLGAMIMSFVVYDLTHIVNFKAEQFTIDVSWLGYKKVLQYQDISSIEVSESGLTFGHITIILKGHKKYKFYFIDDADKIKAWLEQKKSSSMPLAA